MDDQGLMMMPDPDYLYGSGFGSRCDCDFLVWRVTVVYSSILLRAHPIVLITVMLMVVDQVAIANNLI